MIVCDKPRFAVLHVPRTGGTALGEAINRALPAAQVLDSSPLVMHQGIERARKTYGDDLRYFCIMRSPWEIMASLFSQFTEIRRTNPSATPGFFDFRLPAAAELPFYRWIYHANQRHAYRPFGGYSVKFVDDDVTVLQYADRPFAKLAKDLGIRLTKVQRLNGGWAHPEWTKETVEMVAEHDHIDIERYGYKPPKVAAAAMSGVQ